jgi:hypothetical protein
MAATRPANRRGMTKGQIRAERRQRSERRKSRRRAILFTVGGLLALAFIISLLVPGGLANRNASHQVVNQINSGGPVNLQADQGRTHISVGEPWVDSAGVSRYATHPATSGSHWPVTAPNAQAPFGAPVRWGPYDVELPDEALVHNLEHGGIGLHYNCPDGCVETVEALTSMAPRGFSQFVISPYADMDSKIAITSWRHIMYLDEVDEAAIREFIDEYLDRAPESVPGNTF